MTIVQQFALLQVPFAILFVIAGRLAVAISETAVMIRASLLTVTATAVGDLILERAAAIMRAFGRATHRVILDAADPGDVLGGWRLGDECALAPVLGYEMARNLAELRGKVFVNEKDVHAGRCLAREVRGVRS